MSGYLISRGLSKITVWQLIRFGVSVNQHYFNVYRETDTSVWWTTSVVNVGSDAVMGCSTRSFFVTTFLVGAFLSIVLLFQTSGATRKSIFLADIPENRYLPHWNSHPVRAKFLPLLRTLRKMRKRFS